MKLLYSGGSNCDEHTLKRLLLVASELAFMDRPSVTFGKHGTIGHDSFWRQYDARKWPVPISVYKPPENHIEPIYIPYVKADLENPDFSGVVLDGFRGDAVFARKFIQENGKYSETGLSGRMIINALARASDLTPEPYGDSNQKPFAIETTGGLRATLKSVIEDASIQVTSALTIADEADAVPVSDDPYFLKLLEMRTAGGAYVGQASSKSWLVGLEFAKAAIPDEALNRLSVPDVFRYREKSAALYSAWTTDLNAIAAKIDDMQPSEAHERIAKLIATDLAPKIASYRNDMAAVRDDLFAGVTKGLVSLRTPALSIASFATLGFSTALATFAASLGSAMANPVIDYVKGLRNVRRKHAVSYLIGIGGNEPEGR